MPNRKVASVTWKGCWCGTLGALLLAMACGAWAERAVVSLPVKFDYPLLRQLLVKQMFKDPNESAELLQEPGGCNRLVLLDPRLAPRGGELEIVASVDARLGVKLPGGCNELLAWRGAVGFLGRPLVQEGGTAVTIAPSATWLIDADGNTVTSGWLWDVAQESLRSFFTGFSLDLTPYIESLATFLPDVIPRYTKAQLHAIVSSLKLREIRVNPASLNASISFEADVLDEEQVPGEAALTEQELQQWEAQWQMMDALLVMAVKRYASATGLEELRGALLEMLIDSRYRLRDVLASPPDRSDDTVRSWFLQSWRELSPLIRKVALEQDGQEHLLWLSVLTATDALEALDQLGPSVGLDISADGLRRLARMINQNQDQGGEELRYDEAVDPELRRLFQQQLPPEDIEKVPEQPESAAPHLNISLFPRAYAAAPADRLNHWVPKVTELGQYLPLVSNLLGTATEQVLGKHRLESAHRELFSKLVLATAWQESCWRQYVVKNNRIEPLRSASGDVGLMQVNEKVWRGFYDIQKLRWDINYNSNVGAELLLDYLVKYALKQGEHKRSGGLANLARSTYSTYNGGPRQVSRYRRSNVTPGHRKIDSAFWEKYRQVEAGNEMRVAECLGGAAGVIKKSSISKAQSGAAASGRTQTAPADPGRNWLSAQQEQNFTLQMGAFSSREAASKFVRQESLPSPTHIVALGKENGGKYLVLHGVYTKREGADPVKRQFSHLQPWLRQFGQLRTATAP